MTPEIISGSFLISLMAAMGRPQLATGPQKLVPTVAGRDEDEEEDEETR
jgi:hypothetical protein